MPCYKVCTDGHITIFRNWVILCLPFEGLCLCKLQKCLINGVYLKQISSSGKHFVSLNLRYIQFRAHLTSSVSLISFFSMLKVWSCFGKKKEAWKFYLGFFFYYTCNVLFAKCLCMLHNSYFVYCYFLKEEKDSVPEIKTLELWYQPRQDLCYLQHCFWFAPVPVAQMDDDDKESPYHFSQGVKLQFQKQSHSHRKIWRMILNVFEISNCIYLHSVACL